MSKSLARKSLIWSIMLTVVLMGAMLYYSSQKMVVIANSALQYTGEEDGEPTNVRPINLVPSGYENGNFTLKVPEGVKAEDVIVDNKITDREIWIYVDRTVSGDFGEANIEGDVSSVLSGYLQEVRGGVWFKLQMKGLYECLSTLENGSLTVTVGRPKDMHDKVLVLDGAGDAITSDILAKLEEKLEADDIRVYNLLKTNKSLNVSGKLGIANGVDADFYIKLQTDTDLNQDYYGVDAYYNEEFFTPKLDGARLADAIERNLVMSVYTTGHKPLGMTEDYSELSMAKIPAVIMTVGYTSNPEESLLLNKESYRNRVVDGIYNGICEIYAGEEFE
ncbi:MAG: N-acetylmuramoyl-L-alanine amidase [Lachnospiraceae bacterium]|nr:N-acetylmuramoyl-L-alanine amidase [Lachnospiraceae bacterium]